MEGYNNDYDMVYIPTLSELMDACVDIIFPEDDFGIDYYCGEWVAEVMSIGDYKITCRGQNKHIVVANLWLKIKEII